VLVNMAHTFGNGGGFESGLNFTLCCNRYSLRDMAAIPP